MNLSGNDIIDREREEKEERSGRKEERGGRMSANLGFF